MVKLITQKSLRVDEEAVQSFIRAGGAVDGLLNRVARDAEDEAKFYLVSNGHFRSGRLYRGIKYNQAKLVGPLQGVARVNSAARHSLYVHDGTPEIISHPKMIVPINRHAANNNPAFKGAGSEALAANKKSTRRKDKVRGQRAKPFLEIGLAKSMAMHALI